MLVWVNKIGFLKSKYLLRAARWINHEITSYNDNIKLFTSTGKGWFALSALLAAAHLVTYMSVMPCLILAAGFKVNYLQCLLAESLLLFMLYFIPTPGASGRGRGRSGCGLRPLRSVERRWSHGRHVAAALRIHGIAIGTFIVVRMLGWGGADKVLSDENNKIEKGGCGE